MDRRDFLKDLGLLGLEALLLPRGKSMVGWTRSLDSGLYLHQTYDTGFYITEEMVQDSLYAGEDIYPGALVHVMNNLVQIVRVDSEYSMVQMKFVNPTKMFHRETTEGRL
jgi:hypothetical protein